MNDKLEYEFDVPYKEAGAILSEWLDQPQVKYVGHHISADLPWMHYGLDWSGTKKLSSIQSLPYRLVTKLLTRFGCTSS